MCGGGSHSTTTTTSGPPPQFIQAYEDVLNQAKGVAGQPLQQYPTGGPSAPNILAPLQPDQLQAINTILGTQGQYAPTLNLAQGYMQNAASPITPALLPYLYNLPASAISDFTTATSGMPGYDTLSTYFNPYQAQVTQATQALFNQQNAEQQNQLTGNLAAQGAYGGDRAAVAQALVAQQQALAEAPTLGQIQQQGFAQAQQELTREQQLALQGNQLALAAGQGLFGEFNTQAQLAQQAQEATGWLNQGAGYGLANLAQLGQNLPLAGAETLLSAGGLEQAQAQQGLNIPYEQFIQQQAYPFQTTGWLANIAEGLGGSAGGTASTTYPGPSTLGQLGGLASAGAGVLGATGAFGKQGWLTGSGGLFGGGGGGVNYATGLQGVSSADLTGGMFPGYALYGFAPGGAVTHFEPLQYDAGRGESHGIPLHYAPGGAVPDLSLSIVPGAAGLGDMPASHGGGLHSAFMQPITTQTQTQSGGGGGILGGLLGIGKLAAGFFDEGGKVTSGGSPSPSLPLQIPDDLLRKIDRIEQLRRENEEDRFPSFQRIIGRQSGGAVSNGATPSASPRLAVPDLSRGYVPMLSANYPGNMRSTIPAPPAPPRQQDDPLSQGMSILRDSQKLSKLFGGGSDSGGEALGGAVRAEVGPLQGFQTGGAPVAAMMAAANPAMAGASMLSLVRQYAQLPVEKLQELALRYPPGSAQGTAIARALQMRHAFPEAGSATTPQGPLGATGETEPGTTVARGGRLVGLDRFDNGGWIEPPPAEGGRYDPAWLEDRRPSTGPMPRWQQSRTAGPLQQFDDWIEPPPRRYQGGGDVVASADIEPPPLSFGSGIGPPVAADAGLQRGSDLTLDLGAPPPPEPVPASSAPLPAMSVPSGGGNWEVQHNNFGGLRKPGVIAGPHSGGFQSFDTPEQGLRAIDSQLQRYYQGATTGKPLTTLRQIVSTWAPPSENDTPALITRASQVTGFGPDEELTLDPATRAKLIEATIRNEQGGALPVDPKLIANVAQAADYTPFQGRLPGDRSPIEARLARRTTGHEALDPLVGDTGATGTGMTAGTTRAPLQGYREPEKSWFSSPWMPLIAIGAGMLASKSPYPGVALGQGLQYGLRVAGEQQTEEYKRALSETRGLMAERIADIRQQSVDQQGKHFADTVQAEKERKQLAEEKAAAQATASAANLDIKRQQLELMGLRVQLGEYGAPFNGKGPDPDDPTKEIPGLWYPPKVPDPSQPYGGAKFIGGIERPMTGPQGILNDLVHSGAAKDTAEAMALAAALRRDPHSVQHREVYARLVEQEAARLQAGDPSLSQAQIAAQASRNVNARLGAAPGAPPPAAASPAAPATAPQAATPADPLAQARAAIAAGANRDAVIGRLRQMGIDPSGL